MGDSPFDDRDWVRGEVERLAPWYYAFDLNGVRTDDGAPCDHHGHRRVSLPRGAAHYLNGKTVLDVGCNEGGYSFAALDHGAARVDGIDCRGVNIEKARFAAEALGYENVTFHVASCDSWLQRDPQPVDYVFLCGLLYHLPEPWRTIREYCALAKKGVYVTSVLHGGEDGYTAWYENDIIAGNENSEKVSMMPNTTETLVSEFTDHGFHPLHMGEGRGPQGWGGCWLFLKNCRWWQSCQRRRRADPEFGIEFVPEEIPRPANRANPFDVNVVMLNRSGDAREVDGYMTVRIGEKIVERLGPERLTFDPGVPAAEASASIHRLLCLDLPRTRECITLEVALDDRRSGRRIATAELEVKGSLDQA